VKEDQIYNKNGYNYRPWLLVAVMVSSETDTTTQTVQMDKSKSTSKSTAAMLVIPQA